MVIAVPALRAAYASDPGKSRGRLHPEPASPTRNLFRRDCDRIIHCTAFRRLAYKTQVFVFHEGDHFRTRLTHTLEVTQIARSIARSLGLDEDLSEALALAHDLGHPPFGHAGERALDRCLADCGGFDHNAQSLRVVTALERPYPGFDGLNLSWETLEGLVKHNGPLALHDGSPARRYRERGIPPAIEHYVKMHDLELHTYPSLEAQIAAISDDIAYNAHDIDDGLRAHFFSVGELAGIPLLEQILQEMKRQYAQLDPARTSHELIRRMITAMIEDVIAATRERADALAAACAESIRDAHAPVGGFSTEMAAADRDIKNFLSSRLYRHERIVRIMADAEEVVTALFMRYARDPGAIPVEWGQERSLGEPSRLRRIGDFIAGMTDRYALIEHARLFDSTPELR